MLQVNEADLEPYLRDVKDKALAHALKYGMGFLHETMPAKEKEVVNRLFSSGAIQVSKSFKNLKLSQQNPV